MYEIVTRVLLFHNARKVLNYSMRVSVYISISALRKLLFKDPVLLNESTYLPTFNQPTLTENQARYPTLLQILSLVSTTITPPGTTGSLTIHSIA